jgi:hypothetical protein
MSATSGNAGPSVSTTVTVNDAVEECPRGSDAVQVTVVVPIGKVVFGRGSHSTLVPSWPVSTAVGGRKKISAPAELVACA